MPGQGSLEKRHLGEAIGLSFGKATIRKLMNKKHLSKWNKCSGCRRSKLLMEELTDSRATELAAMNRQRLGITMGLLTGYVALKAHLLELKIAEDDICRLCGQSGEDSVHVLYHCPALACKKYLIWSLCGIRGSEKSWATVPLIRD